MPVTRFPDPRLADPDGLLALGGDLHPETLRLAYQSGIFPWPVPGMPMCWFSPPERAILEFKKLHVARSLKRLYQRKAFRITFDQAFEKVIHACASAPRPITRSGPSGTWITPDLIEAFLIFHEQGHAHSVEAWDGDDLAGGLYGVEMDGSFSAESMFFFKPNASKIALLTLVEYLQSRGLGWMDIQVMSPHMAQMGARTIPRDRFLDQLQRTRSRGLCLFPRRNSP